MTSKKPPQEAKVKPRPKKGRNKATKQAKTTPSFGAVSSTTPLKIPAGLIEGRPGNSKISVITVQTSVARATTALSVSTLIEGLPRRSMEQLQQQWINVLRKLDKAPTQELRRFRDAVIAEWAARYQCAVNDPDYFEWPSTIAHAGSGEMSFANWHNEGVLSYLGYHVGAHNGATDGVRRQILDFAFGEVLPPVNDVAYIRDWGPAATASRLKRLAHELARFAKNAKRKRSADMGSAIADWEADLRYLHRKYYVGKFGFGWPATS